MAYKRHKETVVPRNTHQQPLVLQREPKPTCHPPQTKGLTEEDREEYQTHLHAQGRRESCFKTIAKPCIHRIASRSERRDFLLLKVRHREMSEHVFQE